MVRDYKFKLETSLCKEFLDNAKKEFLDVNYIVSDLINMYLTGQVSYSLQPVRNVNFNNDTIPENAADEKPKKNKKAKTASDETSGSEDKPRRGRPRNAEVKQETSTTAPETSEVTE